MNPLNLAFLAPVIMAWGTIKQLFMRFSSLLIARGEVHGQLADWMHVMLWTEWQALPTGPRKHRTLWTSLKKYSGATGPVVLAGYKGPVLFRKGLQFALWTPRANDCGSLLCIRGNTSYSALIEAATKMCYDSYDGNARAEKSRGSGYYLARFQGENLAKLQNMKTAEASPPTGQPAQLDSEDCGDYLGTSALPLHVIYPTILRQAQDFGHQERLKPLERYYVDPKLNVLLEETETWLSGVNWMRERGIAHRRGILLEGEPGTGKSSFVKALAESFSIPLIIVDLATCSDYDLKTLREQSRQPTIFLFEDIDRVFEGSKNVTERETDKVSFDAFLNLLSGTDSLEGMIILTSNHPDKLDPALLRPGRIDRRINIPLLSATGRLKMAERIMDGCDPALVRELMASSVDQPAAAFENKCIQAAMRWWWENSR